MVTDDFSFPTFTERTTNCIISSPLWHTLWCAFSDYHPGDEGREKKLVRECSSVIGSQRGNIDDGDKSDGEAKEKNGHALPISKTSSGLSLSTSKKPGVVAVFKVLKKLLSMNNAVRILLVWLRCLRQVGFLGSMAIDTANHRSGFGVLTNSPWVKKIRLCRV
ncbi:hypothetical protein Acr_27g0004550 [Actinidia rufa]|uniref:Uncharacterized protein n=1 Tax=Actinidia rufa TaxID=165716 RepID=A0A7J0H6J0_9ERIC|nr:hypothetical protein Acr_27g0004550 [Actinidia rufa]